MWWRAGLLAMVLLAGACSGDRGAASDSGLADGAAADAGAGDAGSDDARPGDDALAPADASEPPARYPRDVTQSPLTPAVARHLRAIAATGPTLQGDVFAKVGDSITVSTAFMACFAGSAVDLGDHADLQPTLDELLAGDAAGGDPFTRVSSAASVGKFATWALSGTPSPLDLELQAITPRYALVMFGTNDVGVGRSYLETYAANMLTLVDELAAAGVVPILSTIPPRDDDPTLPVDSYNEAVRAIAQGRQVPLVDFHRELLPLPAHGLGPDGVHPNSYLSGSYRPCALTAAGLQYGYNVRNLISLEALDRSRRAVESGTAFDPPAAPLPGTGGPVDPFVIDSVPFVDLRDTSTSPYSTIDSYPGCQATQDESGPEWFYRLDLAAATTIRATVLVRGTVDVDIHLLSAPSGDACLARDHHEVLATVGPGTFYLAVDTWVGADNVPRAGEYLLLVMAE